MNESGDSPRIVFPKFDLGKLALPLNDPVRTVYATIDRNFGGQQIARSIPCQTNASSWMDFKSPK